MLKSISNIAWHQADEDWVLRKLREQNWDAIEIAPSRIWEDFRTVPRQKRIDYQKKVECQGLKICSMHSLFWGTKGIQIFGGSEEKRNMVEYLNELVDLAVDLKSRVMVLGSPAVRDKGEYEYDEAITIAARVLHESAEYADANGIKILIEPLTKQETNFINTHLDGLNLVEAVNSNGFGLHLDGKSIAAEETDLEKIILCCKGKIEHFHINDPGLQDIGTVAEYHTQMGLLLKRIGYDKYVSIEMRQSEKYRESISNSMQYVDEKY